MELMLGCACAGATRLLLIANVSGNLFMEIHQTLPQTAPMVSMHNL